MGKYDLNANLKKSDFLRILAEVFALFLKIKYFYSSQEKSGLF